MTTGLNCIIIHPSTQSALLPFQTLVTLILHKPTRVRHAHHHPDAMRKIRSDRPNDDDDARARADAAIRRHRPRVRER